MKYMYAFKITKKIMYKLAILRVLIPLFMFSSHILHHISYDIPGNLLFSIVFIYFYSIRNVQKHFPKSGKIFNQTEDVCKTNISFLFITK